ncbi:MAG: OB-fold nucleic acid binding domain-containing protein, partial [Rikenellaceae bacterium]
MRSKIKDLLQMTPSGQEVTIKGWVRTKRGNKNVAFIAVNDGSIIHSVQVVADVASFDEEILKNISTGACVRITGKLVESAGSGQPVEIQATEIEIYGG